jgi:hypothetical protein
MAPSASAAGKIEVQVIIMVRVCAGTEYRGEMEAGAGANGALERFLDRSLAHTWLDRKRRAALELEGCNVNRRTAGLLSGEPDLTYVTRGGVTVRRYRRDADYRTAISDYTGMLDSSPA